MLLQQIPPEQLLRSSQWDLYFSTFLWYLSHPASTVRQVSSTLFKFLGELNVINMSYY